MNAFYFSNFGDVALEVAARGYKTRAELDATLEEAHKAGRRIKSVRITEDTYAEMTRTRGVSA